MVFMVFSIFSFSASTDLDMKTLGAKLSTVKGTGTYKTYLEIKGFEETKLMKVYYKETGYKWDYKIIDSRKLSQTAMVSIKVDNVLTKKTRKAWYALLESTVDRSENGAESRDLASKKYTTIYAEWIKGYELKTIGEYVAKAYREKIYPSENAKYTKFWIESDWYTEDDLKYNDIILDVSGSTLHPIPVFVNAAGRELYTLPSYTGMFTAKETLVDGIGFKKVNGNILVKRKSLEDKNLILTKDKVKEDIILKENDILTPAVTSLENIGKMVRVNSDMPNTTVGGFVFIIRLYLKNQWLSKYILYLLSSPFMIDFMKSITNKSGQAFYNIGKERLSTALLPIPSLAEQHRIVAQIEKLFEQLR